MIPVVKTVPDFRVDLTKIFLQENALTQKVSKELTNYGEEHKSQVIKNADQSNQVSKIEHVDFVHSFLGKVWENAIMFFDSRVDFVEPYALKKYSFSSGYFNNHTDHYKCVQGNIDRKLTMIVQLSNENEYIGGDLIVEGKNTPKTIGTAIVFPSFFSHRVISIKWGIRWSLVSFAWGPAF